MNSDDPTRSIIPVPDASLTLARPEGGRVLSELLSDTLALARGEPLRKIGEYEWCEPDYRQILLWAEALGLEPEEVIRRMLDERTAKPMDAEVRAYFTEKGNDPDRAGEMHFKIFPATFFLAGRIVNLNWDFDLLPVPAFQWIEGLEVECLRIVSTQQLPPSLFTTHVVLRKLRTLCCDGLRLHSLDLSAFPNLEFLSCAQNDLSELELFRVPRLTFLDCSKNRITRLELSGVEMLNSLWCSDNGLTRIDLSRAPMLTCLYCSGNQFPSIDLSSVPELETLDCGGNELIKLDLSCVPKLGDLDCCSNQLMELDLCSVPELYGLDCCYNHLTRLDVSCVPKLRKLVCDYNEIEWLDVRPLGENFPALHWEFRYEPAKLIQRPDQHFK